MRDISRTAAAVSVLAVAILFALTAYWAAFPTLYTHVYRTDAGLTKDGSFWRGRQAFRVDLENNTVPAQLPGPMDSWAGGEPKEIQLELPFEPVNRDVEMRIVFMDSHESAPPILSMLVGGRQITRAQVPAGNGLPGAKWKTMEEVSSVTVILPKEAFTGGANDITIRSVEGSWAAIRRIEVEALTPRWLRLFVGTGWTVITLSYAAYVTARRRWGARTVILLDVVYDGADALWNTIVKPFSPAWMVFAALAVKADNTKNNLFWTQAVLAILAIKLILLIVDPSPSFFLGDSVSYMGTALRSYIPLDRSFVYGFFIRAVTYHSSSLTSLVILQMLTGAMCAIIIMYLLVAQFNAPRWVAFLFGALCAIEPIQLRCERQVMTEALSLFIFAIYTMIIISYLKSQKLSMLVIASFAGLALISVRLSFLPLVLVNTALAPLLAVLSKHGISPKTSAPDAATGNMDRRRRIAKLAFAHIAVSVLVTIVSHGAYKSYYGKLLNLPPAYNYKDGIFLVSAWIPFAGEEDFPDPDLRAKVFNNMIYDIKNVRAAAFHAFSGPGSFSSSIIDAYGGDIYKANGVAKKMAVNAMLRDPLGLASRTVNVYKRYFDIEEALMRIDEEFGLKRKMEWTEVIDKAYLINSGDVQKQMTFTKKYFKKSILWFWVIFFTPLIIAVSLVISPGRHRAVLIFLLSSSAILFLNLGFFSFYPTIRYMQPLAWILIMVIGVIVASVLERAPERSALSPHDSNQRL